VGAAGTPGAGGNTSILFAKLRFLRGIHSPQSI
jgi:hypothetical protein